MFLPSGHNSSIRGSTRGSAIVEFLMVFPVLMVFLYGIVVVGRLFSQFENVQQGAFVGALLAADLKDVLTTNSADQSAVRYRIKQIIGLHKKPVEAIGDDKISISANSSIADAIDIEVEATLTYLLSESKVKTRVTVPVLNKEITNLGGLEVPQNPTSNEGGYYVCNGNSLIAQGNCYNSTCAVPCF